MSDNEARLRAGRQRRRRPEDAELDFDWATSTLTHRSQHRPREFRIRIAAKGRPWIWSLSHPALIRERNEADAATALDVNPDSQILSKGDSQ